MVATGRGGDTPTLLPRTMSAAGAREIFSKRNKLNLFSYNLTADKKSLVLKAAFGTGWRLAVQF